MSDLVQAKNLLDAAQRDLNATTGMLESKLFADEIFGFHVQQTIEKSLKAWLSILGEVYPLTHDLSLLLRRLEGQGCDISAYIELSEFSAFARQIRYMGLGKDEEAIERQRTLEQIERLYFFVESILKSSIAAKQQS
ncbi:MAG: HEPN domain-containing protein [Phormidesmis sp.]